MFLQVQNVVAVSHVACFLLAQALVVVGQGVDKREGGPVEDVVNGGVQVGRSGSVHGVDPYSDRESRW